MHLVSAWPAFHLTNHLRHLRTIDWTPTNASRLKVINVSNFLEGLVTRDNVFLNRDMDGK